MLPVPVLSRHARRLVAVGLSAALLTGAAVTGAQASTATPRPAYQSIEPVRVASGVAVAAGGSTTITIPAVPAGATGVALNVTGSKATAATALKVCAGTSTTASCADAGVVGGDGLATPSFVLATLGGAANDQVTVVNGAADVRLYVDLGGFVVSTAADAAGASFVPQPATRVLAAKKLGTRAVALVELPNVPAGATAVAVSISATAASTGTYVSACPAAQPLASCQKVSTLNPSAGVDRQNFTVVGLSATSPATIQLYNNAGTVVVDVDVEGYFVAGGPTGSRGRLTAVAPTVAAAAATLAPGAPRTLTLADVPRGATAVYLGLESSGAPAAASVTACPGPVAASACTSTAMLRSSASRPAENVAVVPLGGAAGDQVTLYAAGSSPTVAAEVRGWVVPDPTMPDATTTGVRPGRTLTPYPGDLKITTPGTVVDGLDVSGVIIVRADDVTIRNTRVHGQTTNTYTTPLIRMMDGYSNLLVQDTELIPDARSPYLYGIIGWNFTLERVHIARVIDGVHIIGPNVTVRSSYIHDLNHYDADPNNGGGPTHDDAIQVQIGTNLRVEHNTIVGGWNSAIQVTQDRGPVGDFQVTDNAMDGGWCTVNLAEKSYGPLVGVALTDNTFGRATRLADCAVISPTTTTLTEEGNASTDGTDIRVRKG